MPYLRPPSALSDLDLYCLQISDREAIMGQRNVLRPLWIVSHIAGFLACFGIE